jgi:hypothetical protein
LLLDVDLQPGRVPMLRADATGDGPSSAHSREPFTGPRELLVGMADPVRLADRSPTVTVNAG